MGANAKISPFAPNSYPRLPAIEGVRIATAEAGIRYRGRTDLLVAVFDVDASAAGCLAGFSCASAPAARPAARRPTDPRPSAFRNLCIGFTVPTPPG